MAAPALSFTTSRLIAGIWHGLVARDAPGPEPRLSAWHLDTALDGITLHTESDQSWRVEIAIPATLLSDGVQTIVLRDEETGATLDSLTLIAGEAAGEDLRAEVDLLRAELDMLKRAFRRHCVETSE